MEDKTLANRLRRLAFKGPIKDIKDMSNLFRRIDEADPDQTIKIADNLLELLARGSSDVSLAAEQLLGCLNVEAIEVVAPALQRNDPIWRLRIISILWRLAGKSTPEFMDYKGDVILASFWPLLEDPYLVEYETDEDLRDEQEYLELRICDEIYLLITELHGVYTEAFLFAELDYDDRDEEIQEAKRFFSKGPSSVV